jgi:hypothetical protein
MWIGAAGFAGLLTLVTWQALRGQPLIHPDAWTLSALAALTAGLIVATVVALTRPRQLATVTYLAPAETHSKAA